MRRGPGAATLIHAPPIFLAPARAIAPIQVVVHAEPPGSFLRKNVLHRGAVPTGAGYCFTVYFSTAWAWFRVMRKQTTLRDLRGPVYLRRLATLRIASVSRCTERIHALRGILPAAWRAVCVLDRYRWPSLRWHRQTGTLLRPDALHLSRCRPCC